MNMENCNDEPRPNGQPTFDELVDAMTEIVQTIVDMIVAKYEAELPASSRFAPYVVEDDGKKMRPRRRFQEMMSWNRYDDYMIIETDCPPPTQNQPQRFKRSEPSGSGNQDNSNKKQRNENEGQFKQEKRNPPMKALCSRCNIWHYGPCPPTCQDCKKKHFGKCYRTTGACYNCGGMGHIARLCPKPQRAAPANPNPNKNDGGNRRVAGRMFTMVTEKEENPPQQ